MPYAVRRAIQFITFLEKGVRGLMGLMYWGPRLGSAGIVLQRQKILSPDLAQSGFSNLVFDQAIGNYVGADISGFDSDGTKYWWRVKAGNSAGWSGWSLVWWFINR